MRISSSNATDASIDNLLKRQAEMAERQERLTLGKRVAKASDDPAAAARAERALAGELRATTSQRAVEASRTFVLQAESAMADGEDLLQQAREAIVASGNAVYTDAERQNLATKLSNVRQQLMEVVNRTDGAGTYLFGGQGATAAPFTDQPGGTAYQGVAGQLSTERATALPLSVDGRAVWMSGTTGNGVFTTAAGAGVSGAWIDNARVTDPSAITGSSYSIVFDTSSGSTTYAVLKDGNPTAVTAAPYTSGQDIAVDGMSVRISGAPATGDSFALTPSTRDLSVFDTLDRAIAGLRSTGQSKAQISQLTADTLRDLDSGLSALQGARAGVGEVLNRTENEDGRLQTQKLAAQTERSAAEDLDMVSAISEFQSRQSGYDAALKSYSMVQRLSLFQYVNA